MNKAEFIFALYEKLPSVPYKELEERLAFYIEMIDDRMEDGLSEEEAVAAIGTVEEIAAQILADIPIIKLAKETYKPKTHLKAWEIILLILGSPVWFSLLIAAFAVVLSLYATLWSVLISLWAVFVSLAACALAGIVAGSGFIVIGYGLTGIAMIGAGIFCVGLTVFLFWGCNAATKGILSLTKKIALGMKHRLMKKEEA